MKCQYCGLESTTTNHGSPEDCIVALERELARLRRMIESAPTESAGAPPQRKHIPERARLDVSR